MSISPTITWNAISDSNSNDYVELEIDGPNTNKDSVVDQQLATTATSYGPVSLSASSNYELELP